MSWWIRYTTRADPLQRHNGATENAGVENAGSSKMEGVENAGVEIAAP